MSTATTMKVRITTTVEINTEAWALEYGCDEAEVRADAQESLSSAIHQHVESLGLGR